MLSQSDLRQCCRQRRKKLPPELQQLHSKIATQQLLRSPILQRAKKVSVFLAEDGELDTLLLIQTLWQRGISVYLPVLTRFKRRPMMFAPFTPNTALQPKYFGILEPQVPKGQLISGKQLNIVMTPLVCFDSQGNRIGMGGGYYDQTFSFKRTFNQLPPKLIGWAHQCQQVDHLPAQKWDVRLNGMATETQVTLFTRR